MDRRKWLAYAAIAAGAGLVGYAVLTGPTDEEKIRAQLDALAEAVSSHEPVGNVVFRASYVRDLYEELLAPDVRISVPEVGAMPTDHRSLALATARLQAGFGSFEVALSDPSIEVDASGDVKVATARTRATLTAVGSASRRETRQVEFVLSEASGTWLVTRIEAQRPTSGVDAED